MTKSSDRHLAKMKFITLLEVSKHLIFNMNLVDSVNDVTSGYNATIFAYG
jgi:hypothetical protein